MTDLFMRKLEKKIIIKEDEIVDSNLSIAASHKSGVGEKFFSVVALVSLMTSSLTGSAFAFDPRLWGVFPGGGMPQGHYQGQQNYFGNNPTPQNQGMPNVQPIPSQYAPNTVVVPMYPQPQSNVKQSPYQYTPSTVAPMYPLPKSNANYVVPSLQSIVPPVVYQLIQEILPMVYHQLNPNMPTMVFHQHIQSMLPAVYLQFIQNMLPLVHSQPNQDLALLIHQYILGAFQSKASSSHEVSVVAIEEKEKEAPSQGQVVFDVQEDLAVSNLLGLSSKSKKRFREEEVEKVANSSPSTPKKMKLAEIRDETSFQIKKWSDVPSPDKRIEWHDELHTSAIIDMRRKNGVVSFGYVGDLLKDLNLAAIMIDGHSSASSITEIVNQSPNVSHISFIWDERFLIKNLKFILNSTPLWKNKPVVSLKSALTIDQLSYIMAPKNGRYVAATRIREAGIVVDDQTSYVALEAILEKMISLKKVTLKRTEDVKNYDSLVQSIKSRFPEIELCDFSK